ncbi:MAG: hypothetical protein JJU12_08015, partial [Chlamydiales bacterium]|nr:hypothetical protein [Chlamydiales bacterium]
AFISSLSELFFFLVMAPPLVLKLMENFIRHDLFLSPQNLHTIFYTTKNRLVGGFRPPPAPMLLLTVGTDPTLTCHVL